MKYVRNINFLFFMLISCEVNSDYKVINKDIIESLSKVQIGKIICPEGYVIIKDMGEKEDFFAMDGIRNSVTCKSETSYINEIIYVRYLDGQIGVPEFALSFSPLTLEELKNEFSPSIVKKSTETAFDIGKPFKKGEILNYGSKIDAIVLDSDLDIQNLRYFALIDQYTTHIRRSVALSGKSVVYGELKKVIQIFTNSLSSAEKSDWKNISFKFDTFKRTSDLFVTKVNSTPQKEKARKSPEI